MELSLYKILHLTRMRHDVDEPPRFAMVSNSFIHGGPRPDQLATVILKFSCELDVVCTLVVSFASGHMKHLSKHWIGKVFDVDTKFQGRIVTVRPFREGHSSQVLVENGNAKPSHRFVVALKASRNFFYYKPYLDVRPGFRLHSSCHVQELHRNSILVIGRV
jgi:hypothetical protein